MHAQANSDLQRKIIYLVLHWMRYTGSDPPGVRQYSLGLQWHRKAIPYFAGTCTSKFAYSTQSCSELSQYGKLAYCILHTRCSTCCIAIQMWLLLNHWQEEQVYVQQLLKLQELRFSHRKRSFSTFTVQWSSSGSHNTYNTLQYIALRNISICRSVFNCLALSNITTYWYIVTALELLPFCVHVCVIMLSLYACNFYRQHVHLSIIAVRFAFMNSLSTTMYINTSNWEDSLHSDGIWVCISRDVWKQYCCHSG